MVIVDIKEKLAFLKPYRPNKNSKTLVITIAKPFAEQLGITESSSLVMKLEDNGRSLKIEKIDERNL